MASGSDMAEALNALLENVKMPLSQMEQNIQALFAKRGAGKGKDGDDIPWQVIASEVGKGPAAIKATLSAIKSYVKAKEEIEKLLKKVSDNSEYKRGSGALSDEQVYYRTGWKLTKGGFQWTRPRSSPYSENVPSPSVPRYRADYAGIGEIDDALASTPLGEFARSNVHPAAGFFPVTMEDAARFRREDAEQSARRSRFSRIKHEQQAARMRLDMSDYDLFIHENKAKYGGREYADKAYRKMLLKNMPTFFKDSKLSTKALIGIHKVYESAKGVPIIGSMARTVMAHPIGAAVAASIGAVSAGISLGDKSNKTVLNWENAYNLYGKPSESFESAARLAGMQDKGQIAKLWGELNARFGDAEMALKGFASALKDAPDIARISFAKSRGLDDTVMSIADQLAGTGRIKVDTSREVSAETSKLENVVAEGWKTGSGAAATLKSIVTFPSIESRRRKDPWWKLFFDLLQGEEYSREAIENFYNFDKTRKAAESLDEAEKSGIQTTNNQTVNNESRAIYIAKVEVPANNPEEFAMALDRKFGGASGGDNRAVLAAMGSGFLV